MQEIKTKKLISALSRSEQQYLKEVVNNQKRESLTKLYNEIRKNSLTKSTPDRKKIFSKIYGKPYKKTADYLLRNELRLLNKKVMSVIEHFSLEAMIEREDTLVQEALLKSLLNKGLYVEFKDLYKKVEKSTLEKLEYDRAQRLARMYFNFLMTQGEITPELLIEARDTLKRSAEWIKLYYRTQSAINVHGRIGAEATLRTFRPDIEITAIGPETDFTRTNDAYIRFFEEASMAILSGGKEKVNHAKKAAESIESIESQFKETRIDSLAILAGAYYLNHEYDKAEKCYAKAASFASDHHIPLRLDVLFNYCSALLKRGNYDQAIKVIEEHEKQIENNQKVKFRFECLHCFCYIFKGDERKAFSIIPKNIGKRPETEHQYFRFIYVILYWLREDYEGGLRETTNLLSYFNRHLSELSFPQEKEIASFFKHFYQILCTHVNEKERKALFSKLSDKVTSYTLTHQGYRDVLYVKWLMERLQN